MQVRADWLWLRLQFVFTRRLASALLAASDRPAGCTISPANFGSSPNAPGSTRKRISYQFTEMGPRMMLPEIVRASLSFDFPHPPDADRVYLVILSTCAGRKTRRF